MVQKEKAQAMDSPAATTMRCVWYGKTLIVKKFNMYGDYFS